MLGRFWETIIRESDYIRSLRLMSDMSQYVPFVATYVEEHVPD